jgi:hypothetical protein
MEEVLNQIELADPKKHVGEINNVVFDGLGLVRKSVAQGIESVIPYRQGKDYHQHGVLRGKQYGPLKDDVKRSVSKDASGGSVSIYSPKNGDNRWCVLQWLNAGTLERTTGGRTRIGKNGETKFVKNGGQQGNRGSIKALNFFMPSAQSGVGAAETYILNETIKILTKQ